MLILSKIQPQTKGEKTMTEAMKERDFINEVLQNFKEDYNSLTDPTYCNINVGFGSLKMGVNVLYDSHSFKIENHDDLYFERIDNIIKRFIHTSSIPSMKGRRSIMNHSNITVVISILNDYNHYSGRIYELLQQKDGNLLLIDVARKNI